ncbi:hypothetical protein PU630_17090 [Microbacterium horticulturae]|uniref:Uncharacterized protein n=1 Tax=Microbacterium horticulturae TaxID=3028316 RepID=A0ABY8BXN4_9MICO|nr:hypothetical protein [Microbacterium sp. KACC 23027]WEG08933.1 hypothetical protein PU630_17090 [Microbacterium sp. KACC 23027]
MTLPFDASALTEPVDKKAARAFWKSVRPAGANVGRIIGGVFIAVFLVFFIGVAAQVLRAFFAAGADIGGGFGTMFMVVPIIFLALIVVGALAVGRNLLGSGAAVMAYRLDRFAHANGMAYDVGLADPQLPGMIFQRGHDRRSSNLVRGQRPRFVEFGNYRYKTGSGKSESTHTWGYVAIKLDAPLPNIVLDAKSNNGLFGSNLPASFARGQRLSLEGDFDDHFALYCPEGYEQDALYLFTPDIMARFVDHAAALDVEIVDDWLFLYAQRHLSTLDPATWQWLFATVGAILDKMAQWARWRDDRLARDAATTATANAAVGAPETGGALSAGVGAAPQHPFVAGSTPLAPPPPGVAPQGRRLRGGVPVAALVGVAVIAVGWFFLFAR